MKILFSISLLLLLIFSIHASAKSELNEFLAIAPKMNSVNIDSSIIAAESIVKKNNLAAIMLYLIYSRGYYGKEINYKKAAQSFNCLLDSVVESKIGSYFWSNEYQNIWEKMRLIPTKKEKFAFILTWGGNYKIINQRFNLKGKYPLIKCYEEEMNNIGGITARTIFSGYNPSVKDTIGFIEVAKKMNYAKAFCELEPLHLEYFGKISPKRYNNFYKAAELGFVPAKISVAAIVSLSERHTGITSNPALARKYLLEVIKKCNSYKKTPCKHYQKDLLNAQKLLKSIPDEKLSTEELLKLNIQGERNQDNRLIHTTSYYIAKRDDHPDCYLFKASFLPNNQKDEQYKLQKISAEKGSKIAINFLMNSRDVPRSERWYFFYLAGKYKLPLRSVDNNIDYFTKAYMAIKDAEMYNSEKSFKKELSMLAKYSKAAQDDYNRRFGDNAINQEFVTLKISDSKQISSEWKEGNYGKYILLKITQNEQQNYIDFFFDKASGKESVNINIILFSRTGVSNYDLWINYLANTKGNNLANRNLQEIFLNKSFRGLSPKRMRINIGPGNKTFELKVIIN